MPNCWDPNQARHSVGPDLGPNCYQQTTKVAASTDSIEDMGESSKFQNS